MEGRAVVTYLATEQPEVCRWCGVRTTFIELSVNLQLHLCYGCGREYLVESEDEDVVKSD